MYSGALVAQKVGTLFDIFGNWGSWPLCFSQRRPGWLESRPKALDLSTPLGREGPSWFTGRWCRLWPLLSCWHVLEGQEGEPSRYGYWDRHRHRFHKEHLAWCVIPSRPDQGPSQGAGGVKNFLDELSLIYKLWVISLSSVVLKQEVARIALKG